VASLIPEVTQLLCFLFMVGSFVVLSSFVDGAPFIWFWKCVTSHAVSKEQPIFFLVCIAVGIYWLDYIPLYKHLSVKETEHSVLTPQPSCKVLDEIVSYSPQV